MTGNLFGEEKDSLMQSPVCVCVCVCVTSIIDISYDIDIRTKPDKMYVPMFLSQK